MATRASKIDTLWIPEKPNVAKEVTAALVRVKRTRVMNMSTVMADQFYHLESGDIICSVFGHMLQMLPPSRYLTKEQNSNPMSVLPLIPAEFKFEPSPERTRSGEVQKKDGKAVVSKRFQVLEKLIKQAKTIVNGCDIDREGQLIFDELVAYVGRDPYGANIKRASIVSMTPEALDDAVRNLDSNSNGKWMQRGAAAATRQKMDWLLGMNASMAYQVVTGIRTMSVGRVQTPVLAMVVRRDLEIENFKSQTYYVPVALMSDGTRLRWEKREGAESQPGFDATGRILSRGVAEEIVSRIRSGLPGEVIVSERKETSESPPLLFSMGSLQSEAAKRHGLTVAEVTKAAQNLYERHKAITYVGTDCRFLPEAMHEKAPDVLNALSQKLKVEVAGSNPKLKSKAFNDSKVDEHFAIVPTGTMPTLGEGDRAERAVFDTISRRYISQFYPEYRGVTATLAVMFGGDEFRATASKDVQLGWKEVEGQKAKGEPGTHDDMKDADLQNQSKENVS